MQWLPYMRFDKTGMNQLHLLVTGSEAKLVYANISETVTVAERLAPVNTSCETLLCLWIQFDLLSDTNQNMTLEEVFQFVEKKEAGKRSANPLLESHGVDITSQYK